VKQKEISQLKPITQKIYQLAPLEALRAKQLFLAATELLISEKNIDKDKGRKIYQQYCDFIDYGARHNEFLSRHYIWEITGIEWGATNNIKIKAVANLTYIISARQQLKLQLITTGVENALFKDSMLNKLSIIYPNFNHSLLEAIYSNLKKNLLSYLTCHLRKIITELSKPVYLYEYHPQKSRLINISNITHLAMSRCDTNNEYSKIISEGLKMFQLAYSKTACSHLFFEQHTPSTIIKDFREIDTNSIKRAKL
jgi:hypothetical protein